MENLAKTAVSLAQQLGNAPTGDDTLEAVTRGDTDDIDHLVGAEDGIDWDLLLQKSLSEGNLLGDGLASVDLKNLTN